MIDFTKLDPAFSITLQQLITNMEKLGHTVNPYYGLRTLEQQAKLWRQSRSAAQVRFLIDELNANGALYAASVLDNVGPQPIGPRVTGTYLYSFHLIGQACDVFIDKDTSGGEVYDVLADEAVKLGLTPGRYFSTPDPGHVQMGGPELAEKYTMAEMDGILKGMINV